MTKQAFEQAYNVATSALNWEKGWNGLYMFANVGPYTVYRDGAWGYYVTGKDGSRINRLFDLSKFLY